MALSDAVPFAVAHWALDEASGTRTDTINGYNLTDNNTVGSTTGVFDGAADFETDNNEFLSIADNADLSGGDVKLLFRVLVKLESKASNWSLLAKSGNSHAEYQLRYRSSSDRFDFIVFSSSGYSGSATVQADNFGSPSTGVWYLIHAWHDPDANQIGISVDAGTANTTSHSAGIFNSTESFRLGAFLNSGGEALDGALDDVVVLRGYLLDATERTEDYNSGSFTAFADWAGGGGGAVVPALDQGMLTGGLSTLCGGLA